MRVVRVRLRRFRGFADMVLCPAGHVVVVGEPRAGRTDLIIALRRVLEPRSTMARPDPLDVHRPLPSAGEDVDETTEVEVTLVDLDAAVEQELEDRLELIDPATGLPAEEKQADEAVMGLRLCYRLRYDPVSETAEHSVEYPKTGIRVPRAERELLAAIVLDRRAPLQLRPDGVFRRLVADADEADLLAALTKFGTDVDTATEELASSGGIRKTIEEVLDAGAAQLLDMTSAAPADDVGFAADDGSVSAILRAMRPTLSLDAAGALPLTAHGSTTTGVLTAAEALVSAAVPGAIVLGDDFGDDLDAASAEYLASRLHRNSGQVWLSTRRPDVVRAFLPEEIIRLTRSHGERRAHQLAKTTDRKERAARRYLHPLLLPAMTARTVGLLEGPHDLEGYTAVADQRLRTLNVAPPAAYGVRMIAPANGDGGKDELPKLARLAAALGFHVRVVLDNDKPGGDAALIAELTALAEHVIRLPEHSSVEQALVSGVDASRLRIAFERLVTEHGLAGINVSSIADADLEMAIVKALKSKGGLHRPFVEAMPPRGNATAGDESPRHPREAAPHQWAGRTSMTYRPGEEQREIIEADDPVLLVCGGAGTGKTTTAAAAVRAHLERIDRERAATSRRGRRERVPAARALFLSFSRSSVAQMLDRTADVLGPYRSRVEITTFHAFAWRLLTRWGTVIGLADPQMLTDAEAKLFLADHAIRYQDMVPRALDLCAVPAVREHLQARWSIIVSDEFQDTDDRQFELLTAVRGAARLLLLGDPNQCIYSTLPDAVGVGPERLDAAMALPGARRIDLPDVSHRDPSNILPAAAAAVRRREFEHEAVRAALDSGRLQVRAGLPLEREADVVAEAVQSMREEGYTVGVFSHHIDATTGLSDQLTQRGIDHEIVGLPECLSSALEAQHAMVRFAVGADEWEVVLRRLAVFVTSSVRGKTAPDLAWMLLGRRRLPATLDRRLTELRDALLAADTAEAVQHAASAHSTLGLDRGENHWLNAAHLLQPLVARLLRRQSDPAEVLDHLAAAIAEHRAGLLTHTVGEQAAPVQLMGLYQTKGREADATIVVLRSNDFYGTERYEPFDTGSRLLYVVLTRARKRTVILLFGDDPKPLVAPLVKLAS